MRGIRAFVAILGLLVTGAGCTYEEEQKEGFDKDGIPTLKAAKEGPDDPDAPEELTSTPSGLKYRILRKGEGEKPGPKASIRVHYHGWLDDGTVFDSSYASGRPATFGLDQVIPGWTEGLQYLPEGGKIELEVPYQLGYGEEGNSDIPPKSTLHFRIELLKVL